MAIYCLLRYCPSLYSARTQEMFGWCVRRKCCARGKTSQHLGNMITSAMLPPNVSWSCRPLTVYFDFLPDFWRRSLASVLPACFVVPISGQSADSLLRGIVWLPYHGHSCHPHRCNWIRNRQVHFLMPMGACNPTQEDKPKLPGNTLPAY